MKRPALLVLALAVALAAAIVATVLVARAQEDDGPTSADVRVPARCRVLSEDDARACYTRAFLAMVRGRDDPRPVIASIADSAWREGGFLLSNCHGVMHTVGRTYARAAGVTLASLIDYLPASNDPGCSAGFAHGLVTGVAPLIDPRSPASATAICDDAATRYQRYSCVHGIGHAFMRIYGDRLSPALELCRAIGEEAPDCAQGAYHDYWFAVAGVDDARLSDDAVTDPRVLCGAQRAQFVRPCWYRAFVDNRPAGFTVGAAADLEALCAGLRGLQRAGCITAASVIGPPDPAVQLELCAGLGGDADAVACIRGTKVQNLLRSPAATFVGLVERCERFDGRVRAACYRWLGKTVSVVTDGRFGRTGCPQLGSPAGRRECWAGARTIDDALVTFS